MQHPCRLRIGMHGANSYPGSANGPRENGTMTNVTVTSGDITEQRVQAIVNSANPSLLGGGGVDGAIHEAAGPHLLEECRKLGGCAVGEAKITNAYDLWADDIIHTVGPVYGRNSGRDAKLLASSYRSCLDLAAAHMIRSIAFPSISTGAYGYPIEEAAPVALGAVRDWIAERPDVFEEIRFVLFHDEDLATYRSIFQDTFGVAPAKPIGA